MKILLRFVNDDWEELVVDGEVVVEGHTISAWQILQAFAYAVTGDSPEREQVWRCNFCDTPIPEPNGNAKYLCSDCKETEI